MSDLVFITVRYKEMLCCKNGIGKSSLRKHFNKYYTIAKDGL